MKEKLLETLFEGYYDTAPMTAEFEIAKMTLCENSEQEKEFNNAIEAEAKMAYKAAFNSALALMGGMR